MHVREVATSVCAAASTACDTSRPARTSTSSRRGYPLHQTPAVVSHESALELYDLSDVIPSAVHISLPRTKRGQRPRPGVRFHTLQQPPAPSEIRPLDGMPVTTPERTIVDSLQAGTQPEQIELAVHQALERGLTTPRRLRSAAAERPVRVRSLIEHALAVGHA